MVGDCSGNHHHPQDAKALLASLPEDLDPERRAVVELEKAGYIQRGQTIDKAGKFSGNEYIIRECPVSQEPLLDEPSSENPTTGKPATASTQTESTPPVFPTQINIEENKITDLSNKDSFPFPPSPPAPTVGPKESKGKRRKRRTAVSKSEMDSYREIIRENTTQVRNMKQYLLTVLYNAPVTMESHYAAQVNYDLYSRPTACNC